jgi:hypothetical protein
VRISQPASGVFAGVSLSRFVPGLTYDVEPILASYLICLRIGEAVDSKKPALVLTIDDVDAPFYEEQLAGGIRVEQQHERHTAHDRTKRRRTRRR